MTSRRHEPADYKTLRRKGRLPVWAQIAWRVFLAILLLGIALGVHWLERDGLKDNLDGEVSFLDIVYFTMISITTTGYGDIVPVTDEARLFDALVVTPIRIFFILIFLGTAYTFVFRRTWEKWRMSLIQNNLHDHVIVVGYGVSGAETVAELIARGTPVQDIVVVDSAPETLADAEKLGCAVLAGDGTRDRTLQAVQIARARAMVVATGSDDTSILVTLTARHLAPGLPISVTVRNEDNERIARQAGATTVINPVSFAGLLLAGSASGPHIADYLADLASSHGRVQLRERLVLPEECGRALAEVARGLGVRVYRDDRPFGFWEPEVANLHPGDVIVEIVPNLGREAQTA